MNKKVEFIKADVRLFFRPLTWVLCKFGMHKFQANHKRLPDTIAELDMPDGSKYPIRIENVDIAAEKCVWCGELRQVFFDASQRSKNLWKIGIFWILVFSTITALFLGVAWLIGRIF